MMDSFIFVSICLLAVTLLSFLVSYVGARRGKREVDSLREELAEIKELSEKLDEVKAEIGSVQKETNDGEN